MLAIALGSPYPMIPVPTPYTVSSILMKGEGVMSPVGFDVKVWDAGLSLKLVVGRFTKPPGDVIVRSIASPSVSLPE